MAICPGGSNRSALAGPVRVDMAHAWLGGAMAGVAHEASGIRADGFTGAGACAADRAFQFRLLFRRQVASRPPAGAHVCPDDDVGGVWHRGRTLSVVVPV